MPKIKIKNKFVYFDEKDRTTVMAHTWHLHERKTLKKSVFYAQRWSPVSPKQVMMHRQILNAPKGTCVDHINGNGLDNRRANIRIATYSENALNRYNIFIGKSGYLGVVPYRDRYRIKVIKNGVSFEECGFRCPIEAAKARDRLAIKHHGEGARLNFPRSRYDEMEPTK